MKSVVIDTPGQVRVETVPDPTLPGADGAVVQVRSTVDLRLRSALLRG